LKEARNYWRAWVFVLRKGHLGNVHVISSFRWRVVIAERVGINRNLGYLIKELGSKVMEAIVSTM
jgi:hypothetical protein